MTAMNDTFKQIKVEKVSDQICDQIIQLMVDGRLCPGDRLPGERQLIELLGVGRSSLREALNRLETLGYIEIRKRQGNFVKSVDATFRREPLKNLIQGDVRKIVQLYELRRDIEQFSAYHAALNRTEDDLHKIAGCLADFQQGAGKARFSWNSDQAFHIALAQASQNFMRVHVVTNIFELSEEFIQPVIEKTIGHAENMELVYRQHRDIYEAVKDQDSERARRCMDDHLSWTNKELLAFFDRRQ